MPDRGLQAETEEARINRSGGLKEASDAADFFFDKTWCSAPGDEAILVNGTLSLAAETRLARLERQQQHEELMDVARDLTNVLANIAGLPVQEAGNE